MLSIPQCVPATSGIYKIVCVPTGKIYVGSSAQLRDRLNGHLRALRKGGHENQYLQRAWSKHGEEAFRFEVVELILAPFLLEREQYWIDKLQACNRKKGFNIAPNAGSATGIRWTQEQRDRVSQLRKGRYISPEWRENLSKAGKGKPKSLQSRVKNSATHMGMSLSSDVKQRLTAIRRAKSRLTEADIRTIRQQIAAKEAGVCELARQYGVSFSLISMIALRKVWADVE